MIKTDEKQKIWEFKEEEKRRLEFLKYLMKLRILRDGSNWEEENKN